MATKEERAKALKAFKKRLKRMQQDDESTVGGGPLSSGKKSAIVAITLPEGFPDEVWQELIALGRIRRSPGSSTFEIVPIEPPRRL